MSSTSGSFLSWVTRSANSSSAPGFTRFSRDARGSWRKSKWKLSSGSSSHHRDYNNATSIPAVRYPEGAETFALYFSRQTWRLDYICEAPGYMQDPHAFSHQVHWYKSGVLRQVDTINHQQQKKEWNLSITRKNEKKKGSYLEIFHSLHGWEI